MLTFMCICLPVDNVKPYREHTKNYEEGRISTILFFSIIPYLLLSCDAFYITRGLVTEVSRDNYNGRPTTNYLQGVEVKASYIGKGGNTGSLLNKPLFTDHDGKYHIFFAGPPDGLDRSVFLEFIKPGYRYKKIFVEEDSKDSDVTIKRCQEKTKTQECWTIDVVLTPEAEQKN